MRFWIDFWAAPDPLFFRPIVRRLQARGHTAWVTSRKFGETTAIADQCGFSCVALGRHGGETITGKAVAILKGAYQRVAMVRNEDIDLAVSFNSYSQGLAAKLLGIPFVTCMDYEYQPANHLAFRLAQKVVVPRDFDRRALQQQGGLPGKVAFFDGLKEHIAMADFRPDPAFPRVLEKLGIGHDDILITMRPPATGAAYHRFENSFFDDAVAFLARRPGVRVLLLPRSKSQADRFKKLQLGNLIAPSAVLDGLNLIYWSDLVVSGGGSMNREAVVLGTRAYTVFKGRMAGVDQAMIANGELGIINSRAELERLSLLKQSRPPFRPVGQRAINQVVAAILAAVS